VIIPLAVAIIRVRVGNAVWRRIQFDANPQNL
jgi:hypothetical protein